MGKSCVSCEAEKCSGGFFRQGCHGTVAGVCKREPDRGGSPYFVAGESNLVPGPVPPSVNSSSVGVQKYMTGAALIFGAYKGASKSASFFDGALDEWRFWNGARPDSAVLSGMRQPIKATREDFYGDPSDPKRQVTDDNYLVTSVLMASWGFDQDCPMAGSTGCELKAILSVYPRDVDARVPRPPGKAAMYTAYTYGLVTGETDYTGRMFYSLADNMVIDKNTGELTIQTHKEGYHQVVVIMSYPGNVAPVPVDFIIRVLPASCVQEPTDDDGRTPLQGSRQRNAPRCRQTYGHV